MVVLKEIYVIEFLKLVLMSLGIVKNSKNYDIRNKITQHVVMTENY